MTQKARSRIEAMFNGERVSPDPHGSSVYNIRIFGPDLDLEDIREEDIVEYADEDSEYFRVGVTVESQGVLIDRTR